MAFDKLVFEEHFDGDTLNRDIWDYEIGFIRNHEPQYYTDRPCNIYLKDSMLHIVTLREDYEGAKYTSASINTMGKFSCLYGRVEMRAKLPFSKGLWPAFWMMGENFPIVNWPRCGEIDIMEMIGKEDDPGSNGEQTMSLHYFSKEANDIHSSIERYRSPYECFGDDFHTWAIEWEEGEIRWYFDDVMTRRAELTEDMLGCFNKPQFILVNTALSDWNDNERPDDEHTQLPQEYIIDYIRVYQ